MSQTAELVVKLRQVGGEQLTQLAGKLNNLGKQTAAASTDFKSLAAELKKTQAASTQSINNLKGYANAWREIANSVQIGTQEFKEANAEAARLEKQLQKTTQAGRRPTVRGVAQVAGTALAGGIFGGPEGLIGGIAGGIIGGVSGAAAGAAIGGGVSQVRQQLAGLSTYAADINRQRQALQLVTKDAGEYQRALSFIDRTSRDLAIPQELITRQFTQLTASVKGAGGNVRDAEQAFLGIAAGIRGTGGSLEQLDSALLATTQVFSKGKVSAEELRQQIGERLPGAFSLFARSMGMSTQELDKALEKGEVSLLDFQKFTAKLLEEYGENAKIIADGPDAAGDRLRTSLSRLQESVGTLLKPIGALFQNIFAGIAEAIDKAARALNNFFNLTKERRAAKLREDIDVITKDIQRLLSIKEIREQYGIEMPADLAAVLSVQQRNLKNLQLQLKGLEITGKPPTGAEPPSDLPGITADGGGQNRAADRAQQLMERRAAIMRNVADLQRKITERTIENNEAIQALGANSIQAFEFQYNDKLTDADKITGDFKKKVEDLAAQFAKAGGTLNTKELVANIETLGNGLKGFAQQEYVQNLGDFFKELDSSIADINARVYENARALQYNADALGGLKDGLIGYSTSVGTVRDSFANLSQEGLKGVEDAIFSLATTGTANFNQFAVSILQATARMIIQQFVLKSIMQALGFGGGGGASTISPLSGVSVFNPMATSFNPASFTGGFEFAMGGIMTGKGPLALKRYAMGGIASSPQLAMFGEGSRPEAYVPLPDGRSIPVTMKGGAGGDVNVTVNVDASGTNVQGNEPDARQLGRAVSAAVQAELVKQQRPGGLLSGTR
jgi:lambda family phage tail tape measure protein